MKEFRYDGAALHAAEHATMLESFRAMIDDFDHLGTDIIAAFVEQWIAGHLFSSDMELARFIRQNQKAGRRAR